MDLLQIEKYLNENGVINELYNATTGNTKIIWSNIGDAMKFNSLYNKCTVVKQEELQKNDRSNINIFIDFLKEQGYEVIVFTMKGISKSVHRIYI